MSSNYKRKRHNYRWRIHVGIVEKVVGDTVYTIEGNAGDQVSASSYKLTDPYIKGYGVPKGFSTTNEAYPTLKLDKTTYTVGDDIKVSFTGSRSATDWIAIDPKGKIPASKLALKWAYLDGTFASGAPAVQADGSFTINAMTDGQTAPKTPLAAGDYTAYYCASNDYPYYTSVDFTVAEKAAATTYTVKFDANGGTGTIADLTNVAKDATIAAPNTTSLTNAGKEIAGWYTDAACTAANAFTFGTSKVTANTTLYAKWVTKVATPTLKTDATVYNIGDDVKVSFTGSKDAKDWVGITKKGEAFSATTYGSYPWAYLNGTGTAPSAIQKDGTITLTAGSQLPVGVYTIYYGIAGGYTSYAQQDFTVQNKYTVAFNTDGGTAVTSQDVAPNGTVTKPATDPTKTGYTFGGWYANSGLTTAFDFTTAKVTAKTMIYAKWISTSSLTVAFDTNGGTAVTSLTVAKDGTAIQPTNPTRPGYTFGGWYTDNNTFAKAFLFTTPITASITLYAKWTVNSSTTYTVTFKDGSNTYKTITATSGYTISLPTNPSRSGYTFNGWFDSNGNAFTSKTTVTSDKTVTASWTSNNSKKSNGSSYVSDEDDDTSVSTAAPTTSQATSSFSDVDSHWAKDAISFVTKNGYFTGTSATEFSPDSAMTRGMLVTVLYRVAGKPAQTAASTFADVDSNAYYAPAVAWGNAQGIVAGVSDSSFSPDASVTREQLATIIYQYATSAGLDVSVKGDLTNYSDTESISEWADDAIAYAVGAGIITGRDNQTIDPKGTATRAEVARVLQVFVAKIKVD